MRRHPQLGSAARPAGTARITSGAMNRLMVRETVGRLTANSLPIPAWPERTAHVIATTKFVPSHFSTSGQ